MDTFTLIFWLGIAILIGAHITKLGDPAMKTHAMVVLTATGMVFVGSKIGRTFLGIE
jgi:hypothetical protein